MTDLTLGTDLNPNSESTWNGQDLCDSLLTVINDILDFSKIEAGTLDLDPLTFPSATALTTL